MTTEEIRQVAEEIRDKLCGLRFGRIFSLSQFSVAIDFVPHNGVYLFIDLSRQHRSAYLIIRKLKRLERSTVHAPVFAIELRKIFSGSMLKSVDVTESGLLFRFLSDDGEGVDLGVQLLTRFPTLAAISNTGDTIYLVGGEDPADPVFVPNTLPQRPFDSSQDGPDMTISEKLDRVRKEGDLEREFQAIVTRARKGVKTKLDRKKRLLANLDSDLEKHGNADQWKRFGDLILANLATLTHEGSELRVVDLYDAGQRSIGIPVVEGLNPAQTAEHYFRRYAKARNATNEVAARKAAISAEITTTNKEAERLETAVKDRDTDFLKAVSGESKLQETKTKTEKRREKIKEAREFLSSDGIEILVGKSAKDNDHLTFRIGRSTDLWMHAADYPGSHVIVRSKKNNEIPTKTLIEAAKLAAFYSEARQLPKAAVNYTQRKFVNKPKRSAPGLVRLSSFKTILVEPEFPAEVKKRED